MRIAEVVDVVPTQPEIEVCGGIEFFSSQQTCCQDIAGNSYLTGNGAVCASFDLCNGLAYNTNVQKCCDL